MVSTVYELAVSVFNGRSNPNISVTVLPLDISLSGGEKAKLLGGVFMVLLLNNSMAFK